MAGVLVKKSPTLQRVTYSINKTQDYVLVLPVLRSKILISRSFHYLASLTLTTVITISGHTLGEQRWLWSTQYPCSSSLQLLIPPHLSPTLLTQKPSLSRQWRRERLLLLIGWGINIIINSELLEFPKKRCKVRCKKLYNLNNPILVMTKIVY